MTLHFQIEYRTQWGQSVEVELCFLSAGGNAYHQRIMLETEDGLHWKGVYTLKARSRQMKYTYVITAPSSGLHHEIDADARDIQRIVVRREWNGVSRLFPADDARTYFFIDHWNDVPPAPYCYTDAFQVARGLWRAENTSVALFPRTCFFRVRVPQLSPDEKVVLVGNQPTLGNWDTAHALPMIQSKQLEWVLTISADGFNLPFEYKYVILDGKGAATWEEGANRQLPSNGQWTKEGGQWVLAFSDGEIRMVVPEWKAAGLVVPLFSLRTEGSQGVGDFSDLKEIVDWAALTGMHAVQLLPIYDTTQTRAATDSYPYNAISVHALHPIYADLRRLPLDESHIAAKFQERWRHLNDLPALDYVEVIKLKESYLRRYYEEQRNSICHRTSYRTFVKKNAKWLQPYSVFCHLRDTYGTSCFSRWPELAVYDHNAVAEYIGCHSDEVEFYSFVQYVLHSQLADAAAYSRSLQVFLKGDLPIGISPTSVEAWQEPYLFNMDMGAGAPPDDFSPEGQNWGFPTYNWERMASDGYLWWQQRLRGMSQYFCAYRIDHILGFFRIWQIPKMESSEDDTRTALMGQFSPALPMSIEEIESYGVTFNPELFVPHNPSSLPPQFHPRICVMGERVWQSLPKHEQDAFTRLHDDFFYHRHNDFWARQALHKLPALINASNMLVCGEDLGMVPACVTPVMKQLGILSLEIESMPKEYGVPFASLQNNPHRSVDTIFTHDMPTLRLWWKENAERTQFYYNNILGHDGKAPAEASGSLCEEIVARHLDSPSMLCLISLQDWLSIDEDLRNPNPEEERINIPANPKHYWRFRMHLPISRLKKATTLNERLQKLIAKNRRFP